MLLSLKLWDLLKSIFRNMILYSYWTQERGYRKKDVWLKQLVTGNNLKFAYMEFTLKPTDKRILREVDMKLTEIPALGNLKSIPSAFPSKPPFLTGTQPSAQTSARHCPLVRGRKVWRSIRHHAIFLVRTIYRHFKET